MLKRYSMYGRMADLYNSKLDSGEENSLARKCEPFDSQLVIIASWYDEHMIVTKFCLISL